MLPTRHLSAFLPWAMPHCQGAPFPQVLQALHEASREFCVATRLWRYTAQATITSQDAVVVAPQYTSIVEFEAATFNGQPIEPVLWSESRPDQLEAQPVTGMPSTITQTGPNVVTLIPWMEGTLRLSMFLQPAVGELYGSNPEAPMENAFHVVPEFIFANHAALIAHGGLSRVLMVPNKPYTNPEMAAYHGGMFDRGLRHLNSSGIRGQQKAPLRVPARFL
jgi:hypothetical protein